MSTLQHIVRRVLQEDLQTRGSRDVAGMPADLYSTKSADPTSPSTIASGVVALGKSQNGWPAHPEPDVVNLEQMTISLESGKSVTLPLRKETADALVKMVKWWDVNVEPVNPGDTGSYNYRTIRDRRQLSNHASGTAVDINGSQHPLGARGTVSSEQAAAITAQATVLGLKWGGTYKGRADEMHFEVNTPAPAAAVAASEAVWQKKYGAAGSGADANAPSDVA